MAGAENQSGRKGSGRDADATRRRLDALGARLSEAQSRLGLGPRTAPQSQGAAFGQALKMGAELVGGVAVGGFLGWGLDRLFGTAPVLMVAFLGLGAAAGIMNVVRSAKRMQADAGQLKDLPKVLDDEDD
ncbi:MAG TPA: AtpZ/AtpI family protein [Methyloceanibacter sp.]|nr:AtpZ/AtpI family protein [Methyloceanibacter sp.]